jgi:DNA (cytosine-5)-methyltransferase 1
LTDRPLAVDLFSGAGGLTLGFEQAGFDVVAAVEIDPIHAAIHELNFPNCATICRDIAKVTGADIRAAAGIGRRPVDVVFGGPPCQGFSLIGHRALEDPRNSLVFHFLRVVSELRPRYFVMENVPGMATGGHSAFLNQLLARFDDAGYRVAQPWRILNAGHFGVPQDRRRLVLLGARAGQRLPAYPEPMTSIRGKSKKGSESLPPGPSVAEAIGDLPEIDAYPELLGTDELRVQARGGSLYARRLRGAAQDPQNFGYERIHPAKLITGCARAAHTDLSRQRFSATEPGETEPVSRFFRLPPDGVCNTLRAGTASDRGAFTSPRPIHPTSPRCISVREAARLHSYPDWFRFHRTIWHGFRQIGNSVPPLLGRAVASSIIDALGVAPVRPTERLAVGDPRLAALNMREAASRYGVAHTVIAPRRRLVAAVG